MQRNAPACWLLALTLSATVSCGQSSPAVIRGDLFLAEDLSRQINLAGAEVRLLPHEPGIDSALARICPTRGGTPAARQPGTQEQAWRERRRILSEQVRRTATTNSAAEFAMDSVRPGRYRLWADTVVGGARWTWLHPVTVRRGDTLRVSLSNANSDEDPFRCRV
jgi:hypothetical protein